ncbi:hypothetical protein U27_01587 [Candidatus Vecturithrix granuli]|uniref:Uncharacterized protein n=1 Tax=Vecturithrix granuli TaxID=1499967 RepID=A0A081CAT1_VECG1|nr:hypothetical protein U27_01587 [Candidatus Vecturithrix granuli]
MIYIVLSLIGILATLVIRDTWGQKKQIAAILCSLLLGGILFLGVYYLLEETGIIEKGGSSFWAKISWREIGLYFSMIAGMFAKYVYDWIGSGSYFTLTQQSLENIEKKGMPQKSIEKLKRLENLTFKKENEFLQAVNLIKEQSEENQLVGYEELVLKYAKNEGNRKIEFQKWQLFKPILVSPLVFGVIYGSMDENMPIILLLIFAFQNGFFWQTVMNKQQT